MPIIITTIKAINAIKLINSNFLFFIYISLHSIFKYKYCNLFYCKRNVLEITVNSTKSSYFIEFNKNVSLHIERKRLKSITYYNFGVQFRFLQEDYDSLEVCLVF